MTAATLGVMGGGGRCVEKHSPSTIGGNSCFGGQQHQTSNRFWIGFLNWFDHGNNEAGEQEGFLPCLSTRTEVQGSEGVCVEHIWALVLALYLS